jgi:hypothetical protein
VGVNYNWTTLSTTETIDDRTLTAEDGTTTVMTGGTQTFTLKTDGYSWVWGVGGEYWVTRSAAIFGDFSWVKLGGKASGGGEGSLDDRLLSVFFGLRVHVFGKR